MNGEELRWVFWGFTLGDLMLAAGRYLLLVSAALLVIKNATWLVRWGGRERRGLRKVRLAVEAVAGLVVVAVYANHLYFGGAESPAATAALGRTEGALVVWMVAMVFVTLVWTRTDDHPPGGGP